MLSLSSFKFVRHLLLIIFPVFSAYNVDAVIIKIISKAIFLRVVFNFALQKIKINNLILPENTCIMQDINIMRL